MSADALNKEWTSASNTSEGAGLAAQRFRLGGMWDARPLFYTGIPRLRKAEFVPLDHPFIYESAYASLVFGANLYEV
jgi:hypothetical protein